MKWKKKLAELQLNENELSRGLKAKIKDFYAIEEGINELKQAMQDEEDDEQLSEMRENLSELEEAFEVADSELANAVVTYYNNKDVNAAKVEKMRLAKEAKKQSKASNPAPAAAAPTPEPTPAKSANNPAEPIAVEAEEVKDEPKKGKNTLLWILGAVVLGLIGVKAAQASRD